MPKKPARPELAPRLLARINRLVDRPVNLMEVCGTHTMAISSSGLRRAVDPRLHLISGPGCPVCVTAPEEIDLALELARDPALTIATFGDMVRVPGSTTSLEVLRSQGADVQVVYSPLDALALARTGRRTVVFLGVGFETTSPTIAACLIEARRAQVDNFYVLACFKLIPPALRHIAAAPAHRIDGFLMPGHVSTIIGSRPYEFLPRDYRLPCVIAGFEPLDILQAILMLLLQRRGTPKVEIQYRRAVRPDGNPLARLALTEVFTVVDANWRGLGMIPASGLALNDQYAAFDARRRFGLAIRRARPARGCRCGEVLLGRIIPTQCRLFARVCTPESPLGPCMVSQEGACCAYYRYERR